MENFLGDRLRKERERLSLTQNEMADVGGVKRNSQGNYERGRQAPDATYLLAIAKIGVDVSYVLFGERCLALDNLTVDEAQLLGLFRSLSTSDKSMILRVIQGLLTTDAHSLRAADT